jgi:hypothetical protein
MVGAGHAPLLWQYFLRLQTNPVNLGAPRIRAEQVGQIGQKGRVTVVHERQP